MLARLTIPLFEGGARLSRIREANARQLARHYDVADARSSSAATVRAAFHRRQAAQARISASRSQLQAARTALKGVKLEAQVGRRSLIDVLDAQRELVDAEVTAAGAVRDHTVATFRLLAALGHAGPQMIAPVAPPAAAQALPAAAPLRLIADPQGARERRHHARAGDQVVPREQGPAGLRSSILE